MNIANDYQMKLELQREGRIAERDEAAYDHGYAKIMYLEQRGKFSGDTLKALFERSRECEARFKKAKSECARDPNISSHKPGLEAFHRGQDDAYRDLGLPLPVRKSQGK